MITIFTQPNILLCFQIVQLNEDLTKGDRQKVNTICTIDVHCRDVVAKMIQQKIETGSALQSIGIFLELKNNCVL